jgi:hypothetical protein
MSKPVLFIALGAVAGAIVGMIDGGGGGMGRGIGNMILASAAPLHRLIESAKPRHATVADASTDTAGPDNAHSVFSTCLRQGGANAEQNLRDLLEFHEHDTTVALVGCLLDGNPQRFCSAAGRRQAADAIEIYLWSRDDAQRTSPAHGLAAKIHLLDKTSETGEPDDPFSKTWSGPGDVAIFDRLKGLVKQGYLDPGAFAFSGRAELREAFHQVRAEATPCAALVGAN